MMDKLISAPEGLTDAEESEWWYERRDIVNGEISQAFKEGRMKRRTPEDFEREIEARRAAKERALTSIQPDPADVKKAMTVAERKGISYQAYLQTVIHEALEKEADAA